uniref:Uncharacterized protein n=1 Tax=Arundo donax TaxID=35708 RepID=A0A0A9FT70_ARUDO
MRTNMQYMLESDCICFQPFLGVIWWKVYILGLLLLWDSSEYLLIFI